MLEKLKRSWVLGIGFLLLVSATQARAAEKTTWDDLTAEYQTEWSSLSSNLSSTQLQELRKYKVILVPGFLSDIVIEIGNALGGEVKKHIQVGEYFDSQMKWLKDNAIEHERLNIESEATPEHNAKLIVNAIESTAVDQKVILLTHSKGGVDTLLALLSDFEVDHKTLRLKELWKSKVAGWISVQSAFGGSKIADIVLDSPLLKALASSVLKHNGGSLDSLVSLTPEVRKQYLTDHQDSIELLLKNLPMINYVSYIEKNSGAKTGLWFSRDLLREKNYLHTRNDGLVTQLSGILSANGFYGDYIIEENVDHAVPVMPSNLLSFERERFTKTLFSMILKRIQTN